MMEFPVMRIRYTREQIDIMIERRISLYSKMRLFNILLLKVVILLFCYPGKIP